MCNRKCRALLNYKGEIVYTLKDMIIEDYHIYKCCINCADLSNGCHCLRIGDKLIEIRNTL